MKLHALSLALLLFLSCADAAAAQPRLSVSLGEAMVRLSGVRGNQAFFFWLRVETVRDLVIFIIALAGSLYLGAWLMAWRAWLEVKTAWLPATIAILTLVLFVAQLFARPWLFHATLPPFAAIAVHDLTAALRLAFLLIYILMLVLCRLWSYAGRRLA